MDNRKGIASGLVMTVFFPFSIGYFLPFVNDFFSPNSFHPFTFVSWIPLSHFIRKGMTEEVTLPLLRLCHCRTGSGNPVLLCFCHVKPRHAPGNIPETSRLFTLPLSLPSREGRFIGGLFRSSSPYSSGSPPARGIHLS